jgi:beta-glucosidase
LIRYSLYGYEILPMFVLSNKGSFIIHQKILSVDQTKMILSLVKLFALLIILQTIFACSDEKMPYMNTHLSFEERAADLVSRMTLEEKVGQMMYNAPSIVRLGIPEYNWWNECLHGVGRAGLATVFPQAIGMAAMWDSDLMYTMGVAVSDEARAKHHAFAAEGKRDIYQGLTFWTPNINIFRDPRWGRGMETYGEDPFLAGELAVNYIKGLQGDDPRYLKVVATSKHFVVHSGPEPDRHRFNAIPSDRDFVETYLPHFKKTILEGGVYSVMCAYNRLFGDPCCGSKFLENMLREEWGFEGYIVSDCWAIKDFYNPGDHELVNTPEEAAAMAVKAGTDLNCGNTYPFLVNAVAQGLVTEQEIDVLVTRLMVARMRLGMFDPPSQVAYTQIPYSVVDSEKHRQLALEAARKSMVLLKNENNLLPLSKDVKKVAVIGPNADRLEVLYANYNGFASNPITPLEGIRQMLPDAKIQFAPGTRLAKEFPYMEILPSQHLFTSSDLDINGLNAEYFDNPMLEGEPRHKRIDAELDFTWWTNPPAEGLRYDNFSARWKGYFIPPIGGEYSIGIEGYRAFDLYLDGEVIASWDTEHHPHMEYETMQLQAGKPYEIMIEYRQHGTEFPLMKLLWDAPGKDMMADALRIARESDVVILCMGLSPYLEGEEMKVKVDGFAGGDRVEIKLPDAQVNLMKEVMRLNKPTVLVLLNGSAVAINWEAENIPVILEAWYPGQAGGTAIADILFGDYNPSGRLPVTFYKSVDHLPDFSDYSMENRTYKYFREEPLFEFGFGLSYTTFRYSNLIIPETMEAGKPVSVSVDITNIGTHDGEEVVQLYVSHPEIKEGPIRTLQGYQRVFIIAGETARVTFDLKPENLAVYHPDHRMFVPEGEVFFSVGGSQPNQKRIQDARVIVGTSRITGEYTNVW